MLVLLRDGRARRCDWHSYIEQFPATMSSASGCVNNRMSREHLFNCRHTVRELHDSGGSEFHCRGETRERSIAAESSTLRRALGSRSSPVTATRVAWISAAALIPRSVASATQRALNRGRDRTVELKRSRRAAPPEARECPALRQVLRHGARRRMHRPGQERTRLRRRI